MVKKVFVDTNVWLRFLLKDNEVQFENTNKLVELFEEGKLRPYTSSVVLLEVNFVLTSFYKISKKEAISAIRAIKQTRNLTLIEKTSLNEAIKIYDKYNFKLSDCIVVSSLPKTCMFCTWDEELKKIAKIKVLTPNEIINLIDRERSMLPSG